MNALLRPPGDALALQLVQRAEHVADEPPLRAVVDRQVQVLDGDAVAAQLGLIDGLLRQVAGEAGGIGDDQDVILAALGTLQRLHDAVDVPLGAGVDVGQLADARRSHERRREPGSGRAGSPRRLRCGRSWPDAAC